MKYLVCWKEFIMENDMWEKEKDLENTKKVVVEFERRISAEIRQQKEVEKNENLEKLWKVKLNLNMEELRRSELLERYIAKILFR